jgi:hypothetical protein
MKIENAYLTYTFDNKSSYAVQITLFKPYKTELHSETTTEIDPETGIETTTKTDPPTYTTPFSVSNLDVKKVYVRSDGNVDFQWTTSYAEDNSKIYCETNGQKATFKNR